MDRALEPLTEALRRFAAERDWEQFHSPKNLACALAVEAAELLEHFQWLTEERSRNLPPQERQAVAQELADVLLYLLQLADKLNVDLIEAAHAKLAVNAAKYPIERSRGQTKPTPEAPSAPPPQGGATSGPAKPVPRWPRTEDTDHK